MSGALALMYHAVYESEAEKGALPPEAAMYAVSLNDFKLQLEVIKAKGLEIISPVALASTPSSGYDKGALLTFDDSCASHWHTAWPVIKGQGWRAVFFLASGQIGQAGMLSWPEARKLADGGAVLGSHGVTHTLFNRLSKAALRAELRDSKKAIEDACGQAVTLLSLPGGRMADNMLGEAAEAGYTHVFCSRPGLWQGQPLVPRLAMLGARGGDWFSGLIDNPDAVCARLLLRQQIFDMAKAVLGEGCYARLHRCWAGLTGGRRE